MEPISVLAAPGEIPWVALRVPTEQERGAAMQVMWDIEEEPRQTYCPSPRHPVGQPRFARKLCFPPPASLSDQIVAARAAISTAGCYCFALVFGLMNRSDNRQLQRHDMNITGSR
jgi:hypothetical protein